MKEAMKQALEALKNSVDLVSNEAREAESLYGNYPSRLARVQGLVALEVAHQTAIKALEEALAKQEQRSDSEQLSEPDYKTLAIQLQQQRTWVGLTDEEILSIGCMSDKTWMLLFAKAIEAKLKQKNGYAEEKNT